MPSHVLHGLPILHDHYFYKTSTHLKSRNQHVVLLNHSKERPKQFQNQDNNASISSNPVIVADMFTKRRASQLLYSELCTILEMEGEWLKKFTPFCRSTIKFLLGIKVSQGFMVKLQNRLSMTKIILPMSNCLPHFIKHNIRCGVFLYFIEFLSFLLK